MSRAWQLVGISCLASASLSANPTGGSVAAGSARIAGQGTGAVTISQASNLAVINWKTFSINAGESTSFLQPGATSATLNRVLGGQTSLINGTLSANGQVYLVNGNGIIVGPGGVINASAFTASTRDITDANFLSGNLHFTGSSGAGVQNLGTINALGGNVVLIGKTVDNEGTINAAKGTVGLVAGDDVLLAQNNADGSTITVSPKTTATPASGQVGVKNGGAITAAAAELKAANGNIYALAVQNEGTIRATTVTHQGGHIWLTSDAGTVSNSGTLNASATTSGGQGGTVTLKSTTGTASHTGRIIAQGGAGGVGGNAEVSGANVDFTGEVDLTAPGGAKGTLLLDPATIDIVTGGGSVLTGASIDPSAIVSALNGADVNLMATTTITVDDTVDASANTGVGNLTLTAPLLVLNAGVLLNGTLSSTATTVNVGAGGLVQNAVAAVAGGGTVNLAAGATYNLSGELVVNKSLNLNANGAVLNGGGSTRLMEVDGGTIALDSLTLMDGNGSSTAGAAGSNFNGSGGAILVYGSNTTSTLTITNCSFVGNSASSGGAIFSVSISGGSNTLTISNSTFSGNSATVGSVFYDYGSFGGNASMMLTEDTIAANSGAEAIYTDVLSSGIAAVSINSSILAGNSGFQGEMEYINGGGGALNDLDYNLYGQNGNAGGFVPATTSTHDVLLGGGIGTVVEPIANYGGPTPTMGLVAGSPALAAGDPTYIGTLDQRGISRGSSSSFTDNANDIGAVEAQIIDVQANSVAVVYGEIPPLTYTVTSGPATLLTGSPALFAGATNVGSYPGAIQQGTLVAPPAYTFSFTPGNLTITPRAVTVDPDSGQSKTYGSPDPVLTYSTNPATAATGLVNGDTLSGALSYAGAGQFTAVGNYATNLGTLSNSNYVISLSSGAPTFAITPRPVTVDPDPGQGKVYGTPDPALTYSTDPATTTSGLVNGDTLTGALDYTGSGQFASAGNYPINLGTLASGNYTISLSSAAPTFAITPRPVTINPDPGQGKVYGTPDPALTYSTDPATPTTGLVNGDTLTGALSYPGSGQFAGAGSYPINQGSLSNGNYAIELNAATFTISPRLVTVLPDAGQGKIYGTPDPVLTYTITPATASTGLVNGDTLSGDVSYVGAGQFAGAGTYLMNQGTLSNPNYVIGLSGASPSFTITPRPVTILPDAGQSKVYGSPDPALTYTTTAPTATTGLVNGDTLSGSPSYNGASPFAPVGNYATNLGTLSSSNYVVSLSAGAPTFAITPAILYYVADSFVVPVGGPFPTFTGTVTGFVGSDTLATATTGILTFNTPVSPSAPAGIYAIDGSGLSANNYTFMQAAVNSAALIIGTAVRPTMPVMPTSPAAPVLPTPSAPLTPVSQAVAQENSQSASNSSGQTGLPNGIQGGPANTLAPATATPDGSGNPISSNEIVAPATDASTTDASPSTDDTGGESGGLAQGSSFTQASAAVSTSSGTDGTAGSSTATGPTTTTGPASPAAASKNAVAAGAAGAPGPAEAPVRLGPATMVAPGQTITLTAHGSAAANKPPPMMIQTQFQQGFSPASRSTLSAALAASKAAAKPTAKATAETGPKLPPGGAMVAPGQTIRLAARGGAAVFSPPPVMVQTQFDAGFSSQSRDELARAAGL